MTTKDAATGCASTATGLQQLSDAARQVVAERDAKIASLLARNAELEKALGDARRYCDEIRPVTIQSA
jgi:predicted RNA methylase